MSLTAVSLFAGVGGIDLALGRAGVTVTAAVEIDPAARGVLADRFPNTTLFPDVTEVTGDQLRATGFVPERGILTGGFPCQDLSVAGRRRGMGEGTRSGLFWHIVRLAAELQPAWLLLENVPGLLSAVCPCTGDGACQDIERHEGECGDWIKVNGVRTWSPKVQHNVPDGACVGGCIRVHGGAMGAVLGALGDLGYGFAYRVLDAQFTGVPQRRRRVFIVGHLGDANGPAQVLLEPEGRCGNTPQSGTPGTTVAATLTSGIAGPGVSAPGRRQEDDVNLIVAPTLTARYGKGPDSDVTDAVVVSTLQGGGKRGHRIDAEAAGGGISSCSRRVVAALTSSGVGTCGPDDNQAQAGHLIPVERERERERGRTFQKVVRSGARDVNGDLPAEVWAERDVAATLSQFDLGSETRAVELVVQPAAIRGRADGVELELGAPGAPGAPSNALRTPGGGSSHALVCATGPITHTLTSDGSDGSEDGTGRGTPIIAFSHTAGIDNQPSRSVSPTVKAGHDTMPSILSETTVRRLTPMECERLQGFPDGHTATSNGRVQADSARYRQMGNAVAVPCVEWITRRIVEVDAR